MKKFISMMAVVSMLLSLCAVNASAATSACPSINVYAELYDGTNPPSNYKPEDYDVYKVSYTTTGIDLSEDIVVGMEVKYSIDDDTKIAAKSWAAAKPKGSDKDANGIYSSDAPITLMQKGYISWSDVVNGIDMFDYDTYGDDAGTQETLPYLEALIYVTKGESVTFTYSANESMIAIDSVDLDGSGYTEFTGENLQYTVNGVAGNVVTLGAPAPTTYTYTFKNADGTANIDVLSGLAAGATVTAPTAPTVADKKFDHWSDEIGGAAVVVDTTASADKTYYAVYVDAFETVAPSTAQTAKVAEPDAKTYTDYSGAPVVLTKNYAIARFNTSIEGTKSYQIHATASSGTRDFDVNFGSIEAAGSANFVAIIKGAPKDTVMELRVK